MRPGDRIGSLAWNTHQHFELFYGVSGSGAVLHTINPRLFEEQLVYIVNHAEDEVIIVDDASTDRSSAVVDALGKLPQRTLAERRAGNPVAADVVGDAAAKQDGGDEGKNESFHVFSYLMR